MALALALTLGLWPWPWSAGLDLEWFGLVNISAAMLF